MINTETEVTNDIINCGISDLLIQCTPLFMEQISALTAYQMNFLRAIVDGQHDKFSSSSLLAKYQLGSKSNVSRIQNVLLEKDFIVSTPQGMFFSDPVLELWLRRNS